MLSINDANLSLVLLVLIPIYYWLFTLSKNKLYISNLALKENQSKLFGAILEHIDSLGFIRAQGLKTFFLKRVDSVFHSSLNTTVNYQQVSYRFLTVDKVINIFVNILLVLYIGWKLTNQETSIGQFTMLRSFFFLSFNSIKFFFNFGKNYQEMIVSHNRIESVISIPTDSVGGKVLENINSVKALNLSLNVDGHNIFSSVDFSFEKGQIYLIMGENGSGKTSFVKTLVGLNMDKFEGEIFYDDIPIQEVDHWFLRNRLISYVEQDVNLISGSYFENIVVGQETYDEERLTQLLNLFGISLDEDVHDLLNRPVVVGEEKISGGEKRKISITRGLLKDPDLLILDESEADLDGYSRANLLDYLLTTKSDRITIIISHEKTIQSLADKILLLKEKK